MKIRSSFVSNSSSSSFIVIDKESAAIPISVWVKVRPELHVPDYLGGETEFGWGPDTITDIGSRINFAYMQTQYKRCYYYHPEGGEDQIADQWLAMLESVIKRVLGVESIVWNLNVHNNYEAIKACGHYDYIDHQSHAGEGSNTEIFESEEILECFLFGKNSSINLRSDG